MSYEDFLNTLISPIKLFVSALSQVADSLIHNYIVITLLGLTLFISLVWLLYNTFQDFIDSKINKIEDKIDRYNNYELYKEAQREYLNRHRVDEFMYLYDLTILKQQVLNGIYRNNPEVLLDNITQFNKLKVQALKGIKKEYESDDNPDNDDDIYYISPPPPIQNASVDELKKALKNKHMSLEELREYSKQLEEEIDDEVNRIFNDDETKTFLFNKLNLMYDNKKNIFYDYDTGEVINLLDRAKEKGLLRNDSDSNNNIVSSSNNDLSNEHTRLDYYHDFYDSVDEEIKKMYSK